MPSASNDLEKYDPHAKVRNLCEVGSTVEIDGNIPLKRYFRSGKEMLRMAEEYHKDGSLENAFILYTRYITLFVEKMTQHPDKTLTTSPEWFSTRKKLKEVLPIAEKLKSKLLEKYTKEYEAILKDKEREEAQQAKQEEHRKKEQLDKLMFEQQKLFAQHQHQQHQHQQRPHDEIPVRPATPTPGAVSPSEVYPILQDYDYGSSDHLVYLNRPPAYRSDDSLQTPGVHAAAVKPSASLSVAVTKRPSVDRSTKPLPLLSPEPFFLGAQGLRAVVVPGGLFAKFLHLSRTNTERNVETCAILAGKFSGNQLSISHLLVPKQSGTADSCFTESEEEVLEYQDQLGLDTVGWIHTHPTQTAFMSSVDLHTHCSYQLMLPEAIAIVCSPKYEE